MLGENHDLYHELPEHKERITKLRTHDPHFASLFDEYHVVNAEVERTEEGLEAHSDMYTEELKKKRLLLKDKLFAMLKEDATQVP